MTKKSPLTQHSRHVMIYDSDWEWLLQAYGPGALAPIGPGTAVKTIVHAHVERLRHRVNRALEDQQQAEAEAQHD